MEFLAFRIIVFLSVLFDEITTYTNLELYDLSCV